MGDEVKMEVVELALQKRRAGVYVCVRWRKGNKWGVE